MNGTYSCKIGSVCLSCKETNQVDTYGICLPCNKKYDFVSLYEKDGKYYLDFSNRSKSSDFEKCYRVPRGVALEEVRQQKFEQIITDLYNDKDFNKFFVNKKYPQYNSDLKNEIFEYLLKMDKDKIINLYNNNELKKYVRQIILNRNYLIFNDKLKSLDHYRDQKTNYDFIDNVNYYDDNENNLDNYYKNFDLYKYVCDNKILNWYEKEIFEAYYTNNNNWLNDLNTNNKLTQEKIADILGIGREKINIIIKEIKNKIKNTIIKNNDYYNDDNDYNNNFD